MRTMSKTVLGTVLLALIFLMGVRVFAQEETQPDTHAEAQVEAQPDVQADEDRIFHFAITSHRYTFEDGTAYQMGTVTKLKDEAVCRDLARLKGQSVGPWTAVASDCVPGHKKDTGGVYYQVMFNEIFLNLPAAKLYLAFNDESGFPTRVNFGEAPLPMAQQLASSMLESLKQRGIQGAKIIEPTP